MKFGNVPDTDLSRIDLGLPVDHPLTSTVLNREPVEHPRIFLGSSNWGHPSWVGTVYPPKTPATRFRSLYPLHFNAIELNATHYNVYSPEVINSWATPARGRSFFYCPKFPQSISHFSSFSGVEHLTDAFISSISAFGENLGPAFLQVSDQFDVTRAEPLFDYLKSLPQDLDVFLEVRHPSWFTGGHQWFERLHDMQRGLLITDTPGRRDCVHMCLTVPRLFLRFVCNGDHPSSFSRMDEWTDRIQQWLSKGLQQAFIFIHAGDEVYVPALARYWGNKIMRSTGISLKVGQGFQQSLF